MSLKVLLPLWALVALQIPHAPLSAGSEMLDPAREARVQVLGKQLRCAVCQGVSIADSPASMARAQLDRVRELVAEGKSDEEIRDYFVARYGEWVLLEPPAHGVNLLVWVMPGVLVMGGLVLIVSYVRSAGPKPSPVGPGLNAPGPAAGGVAAGGSPAGQAGDPYLDAVRAELERE